MTRIVIEFLVWDDWNIQHIAKHNISKDEVEKAAEQIRYHKHSYKNRYVAVGRSGNRIISVVIKRQKPKTYYVVTARDADKKERKRVYEKEKKDTKI